MGYHGVSGSVSLFHINQKRFYLFTKLCDFLRIGVHVQLLNGALPVSTSPGLTLLGFSLAVQRNAMK